MLKEPGATHALPVRASFDLAAWFLMNLGTMPKSSAKPRPKSAPEDPDAR